jgi:acyl dehydratase
VSSPPTSPAPIGSTVTARFAILAADSDAFARLSGDFNPLHVDPLRARRLQFGSTVVHGIHVVLKALDLASRELSLAALVPNTTAVTFNNPVRTGSTVDVHASWDPGTRRLRLGGTADDRAAFTVTLELDGAASVAAAAPLSRPWSATPPQQQSFPPAQSAGETPLQLDPAILAQLFPQLDSCADRRWLAWMLASTRIVGMLCPGMDSIYAGLKLRRTPARSSASHLQYRVDRQDKRFGMVRMQLAGADVDGSIEAFFRPRPVEQPALAEVLGRVEPDQFSGQHALVVGGSRGLGELVAKLLLAGGADVTITYARGRSDAERIELEARAHDRRCTARPLDVTRPPDAATASWIAAAPITHLYYFATPPIAKGAAGTWNVALFDGFCAFYVHGFATLAHRLLGCGRTPAPRLYYPSTVYLDEPEAGFAEYCAAKAAGEQSCDQLAREYRTAVFRPRLQRMRTDQTSGLLDSGAAAPLPIMLDSLAEFERCPPR